MFLAHGIEEHTVDLSALPQVKTAFFRNARHWKENWPPVTVLQLLWVWLFQAGNDSRNDKRRTGVAQRGNAACMHACMQAGISATARATSVVATKTDCNVSPHSRLRPFRRCRCPPATGTCSTMGPSFPAGPCPDPRLTTWTSGNNASEPWITNKVAQTHGEGEGLASWTKFQVKSRGGQRKMRPRTTKELHRIRRRQGGEAGKGTNAFIFDFEHKMVW